jgi:hypothetical protein
MFWEACLQCIHAFDADAYSRKHKRIFQPQVPLSDFAFRLALLIHVHLISSAYYLLAPCI